MFKVNIYNNMYLKICIKIKIPPLFAAFHNVQIKNAYS